LNRYFYTSDQKELIKNKQEKLKLLLNKKIAAIHIQEENFKTI